MIDRTVWIGFDPREKIAFNAAVQSMIETARETPRIMPLVLKDMKDLGVYQRPTSRRDGALWDNISGAPMSTEFAISRFLVPHLATNMDGYDPKGLALFMDCDVLLRAPVDDLFARADPRFAVQVVKHEYEVGEQVKMDGQPQTAYPRKNWSSVMLFNLGHPALATLTLAKVNTWSGRALHAFNWLADEFIGELPVEWNHLVGVYPPNPNAKLAHFTLGIPSLAEYRNSEYADDWRAAAARYKREVAQRRCPA